MVLTKKGISPVVATALLLVVAVVAVVGFQTWFNSYQSGINTNVEDQSNTGSALTVERIENASGASVVYIKNGGNDAITASTIKIVGCTTEVTDLELNASSINTVNFASCDTASDAIEEVVIVTDDGVFQGKQIVK